MLFLASVYRDVYKDVHNSSPRTEAELARERAGRGSSVKHDIDISMYSKRQAE